MANGDKLPQEHQVARYCFSTAMTNSTISAQNFELRPRDSGKLSSIWVECKHAEDKSEQAAANRLPRSRRGVHPDDRIVFMNVGAICSIIGQDGPLEVIEDVINPKNPCHAAILKTGTITDPAVSALEVQVALAFLASNSRRIIKP